MPRNVIRSTFSRLEVQVGNGSARTGHLLVRVEVFAGGRAAVGQQVLVQVCPGRMVSTAEEVAVAAPCLLSQHAHRILIVTSAYHTRRALAVFRHRLPQYEWSVTPAPDESAYGQEWWRRRAWAKTWLGETERFAWRELVGRWGYGSRESQAAIHKEKSSGRGGSKAESTLAFL